MVIKKNLIGSTFFKRKVGTFKIEEGKEEFYKKLGLDVFEPEKEKDDTNKRGRKSKRDANVIGEDNPS